VQVKLWVDRVRFVNSRSVTDGDFDMDLSMASIITEGLEKQSEVDFSDSGVSRNSTGIPHTGQKIHA
jgi:hypothetical protein